MEGSFDEFGILTGFGRKIYGLDKLEIGWFDQSMLFGYGKRIFIKDITEKINEGLY